MHVIIQCIVTYSGSQAYQNAFQEREVPSKCPLVLHPRQHPNHPIGTRKNLVASGAHAHCGWPQRLLTPLLSPLLSQPPRSSFLATAKEALVVPVVLVDRPSGMLPPVLNWLARVSVI